MTTTKEIEMTTKTQTTEEAMALQMAAAERLEQAETEVRVSAIRLNSLVLGAPLRDGVEATQRYRRALAERDAAQASYEAAQDLDCPEE